MTDAAATLTVWGRGNAYNVQKVLWTLDELGLAFTHLDAGGAAGGLDSPDFLRLNPHARIPVLADGENVIWESNSIVRYLAAAYGADTLYRTDPAERSLAERWMDWELATLQPDFIDLFWGYYRTPEAQRDTPAIDRAAARCAGHFNILDAHLAGQDYLAGAVFGMGDIPAATALHRYFTMGLPTPALPHVRGWYRRLGQRPAFRRRIMQPYEDLRGRTTF